MRVQLLKSKLHMARVTGAVLHYQGSIAIDRDLIDAAGLLIHEKVLVANVNNGDRAETYVIEAPRGSRVIELNGAMARLACVGDPVIVMAFGDFDLAEAAGFEPKVVILDERNAPLAPPKSAPRKPAGKR
jgi:aspartate 1-decarboxylase